jgi:hypothetical protein
LVSAGRLELISINPIRPSLEEYFQSIVGQPAAAFAGSGKQVVL